MNAALTAIVGAANIAVHIVIGAMATQSRLVMIVTLWTFERTAKKNDKRKNNNEVMRWKTG